MVQEVKVIGATEKDSYVIFNVIYAGKILPINRSKNMLLWDKRNNPGLEKAQLSNFIGSRITADISEVMAGDKYETVKVQEDVVLDAKGKPVIGEDGLPKTTKTETKVVEEYKTQQVVVNGFMYFELNEVQSRALAAL